MKKILAIDDQKDNLLTIKALLVRYFPEAVLLFAQSGEEGLDLARKELPDLVLLDILMPKMDGYEVCSLLKQDDRTKDIPILMVSALGQDAENRAKGLQLGADAFLAKPIIPIELHAQVNVFLRIKEAEDQLRSDKQHLEKLVTERTKALQKSNEALRHEISGHQQTEKKLRDSETRLRQIIENTHTWIWEVDADGRYTYASNAIETMYGYKSDEVVGKKCFYDLFLPSAREEMKKAAFDVFRKKKPFRNFINSNLTKTGATIWISTSGVPMLDPKGKLLGYRGADTDITVRREAEIALLENEEKYRTLVERANDGICIIRDQSIEFANTSLANMWGGRVEDIIGTPFTDYVHPSELTKLAAYYKKRMSKEDVPSVYETVLVNREGHKVYVELGAGKINFQNMIAELLIIRNISERKEIQKSLLASENKYRSLFEMTADATLIIEGNTFTDCNSATLTMLGYDNKSELLMSHPSKLSPESQADGRKSTEKADEMMAIAFKKGSHRFEWLHKRKNGEVFPVEVLLTAIPGEKERFLHVVWRDITERKKDLEDIKSALERATESDRLKSAFLATISHELRTPLNAIIGFSDLIQYEDSMEHILSYAKTINMSGNDLLSIVEDLFDITLIESGVIKIEKMDCKVQPLLDEVYDVVSTEQDKMQKKAIKLHLNQPTGGEVMTITTDASKLKQILLNLLKNALKFTHEGEINFGYKLDAKATNPGIIFYVKDTGIGIAAEQQSVIFETFRQIEDSLTKAYGGTGIGLSISKKLSLLLGGHIWLESEEGKGSTFYLSLPLEEGSHIFAGAKPHPEENPKDKENDGPKPKTILIAEDDEDSFELLTIFLKKYDLNILWAKDGKSAVNYCQENPDIDLVLMDINMPLLSGYKATAEIKKFRPHLPIIAQTAYAIIGDQQKAYEAGCDEYITKPIRKSELLEKLDRWLT